MLSVRQGAEVVVLVGLDDAEPVRELSRVNELAVGDVCEVIGSELLVVLNDDMPVVVISAEAKEIVVTCRVEASDLSVDLDLAARTEA